MREKFDKLVKYYYQLAIILSLILILNLFFNGFRELSIILSMIFGLLSIASLVHYLKREYHSDLLMLPIYYLCSIILYYGLTDVLIATKESINSLIQVVGIIFSIAMLFGSVALLFKYRK